MELFRVKTSYTHTILASHILSITGFPQLIEAEAQRLHSRLANGNRVLVILDDVWESLDMKKIGIPIGDECKGCKVALTPRSEIVCTQMGTQKNFPIQVLYETEAWDLLKEMAGYCVDADDDGRRIAGKIAKECRGLPLALDERIPIEELLRYGVCLELFEDLDTLAETRNRVDSLVDELRSSYLLVGEDESAFVKMHDVIRDACLYIASKKEHGYMVRHNTSLEEWPEKDKRSTHTAISLYSNKMQELPAGFDFSNLKLLEFVGAAIKNKQKIPGDVFEGVKELRVVSFLVQRIESQPTLFRFLSNLRVLSRKLQVSCDLFFIGGLQKLEILSFFNSRGVVLPSEAGELNNLKLLDLRSSIVHSEDRKILTRISSGVLSCLRKLEKLHMGDQFFQNDDQETHASVTELNSLSCLKRLEIQIPLGNKVLSMLKDFQFSNLIEFEFLMSGSIYGHKPEYKLWKNILSLVDVDRSVLLENNINALHI
ncbi:hypothetical protein LguiB_005436 [Lonicera macranthoides]